MLHGELAKCLSIIRQILTKVLPPSADQVPVFVGMRPFHDIRIRALPRLPSPLRVLDVSMAVPK